MNRRPPRVAEMAARHGRPRTGGGHASGTEDRVPRGFTDTERERIRRRLYVEGERLFATRGVRGTTVSELARAAGIAKGSFYRFARSKEEFFFDLLEETESEIRREIEQELSRTPEDPAARLRVVLERASRVITERPLFRVLLDPAELNQVARGVSEDRLERHGAGDAEYFEHLFGAAVGATASDDESGGGAAPGDKGPAIEAAAPGDRRGGEGLPAKAGAGLIKVLVLLPTLECFIGVDALPEVRARLINYIARGLARDLGVGHGGPGESSGTTTA